MIRKLNMKYYIVSASEERLKLFSDKIKELDKSAEIFLEERVDFFLGDSFRVDGPAKIIVDSFYDDFFEPEYLEDDASDLIHNEFNGSTGLIDIYLNNNYLIFKEKIYHFDKCEVRVKYLKDIDILCKGIFKELYKDSYSPKKVIFYDSYYKDFSNDCINFLRSEIFESTCKLYTECDVADFSLYELCDLNDVLVLGTSASNVSHYLKVLNKLGFKGRVFCTKHSQYDEVKKLNLPNESVFIETMNLDYLLEDPLNNEFEFVNVVKKYLSFLSGASSDLVDSLGDEILAHYDFSSLPVIYEEIKYIYERNKNNKGITYYDFSDVRELVKKIDNNEVTNIDVFNALDKSAQYVTGIPPVMVSRFYYLGSIVQKPKESSFDKDIIDFTKIVVESPSMFLRNNLMVAYSMFLAIVSVLNKQNI